MRWGGRPSGRPPLILHKLCEPIEFARVDGSRRAATNYLTFAQLASIRLRLCVNESTL